jgi:hypothetical protein
MKNEIVIEVMSELFSNRVDQLAEMKAGRCREEFVRDANALKLLDRNVNKWVVLFDQMKSKEVKSS